jgi:hypothetical protein
MVGRRLTNLFGALSPQHGRAVRSLHPPVAVSLRSSRDASVERHRDFLRGRRPELMTKPCAARRNFPPDQTTPSDSGPCPG